MLELSWNLAQLKHWSSLELKLDYMDYENYNRQSRGGSLSLGLGAVYNFHIPTTPWAIELNRTHWVDGMIDQLSFTWPRVDHFERKKQRGRSQNWGYDLNFSFALMSLCLPLLFGSAWTKGASKSIFPLFSSFLFFILYFLLGFSVLFSQHKSFSATGFLFFLIRSPTLAGDGPSGPNGEVHGPFCHVIRFISTFSFLFSPKVSKEGKRKYTLHGARAFHTHFLGLI